MRIFAWPVAALALSAGLPAQAQEADRQDAISGTAFDGDYISVGVGAIYGPSYDGSDDYVASPIPIIMGSLGGVDITPRGGGLALDFVPDGDGSVSFDAGIAAGMNMNRVRQIEDPVVSSLGKLDTAVEVGPTAGVSYAGLLNPYDSVSASVDVRWDVAGAHKGRTINPAISYFTPLSRGMIAALSISAEHSSARYADYYYSVSPAQSEASGLPAFDADGGGFNRAGVTLFSGIDLDGDITNGGLGLILIGSYSRMLGDAKNSPFTSIRGDANQWLGAVGIGYTF